MTESVGARLKQARELRRLSLQQVAEATKLRIHYLQALENDDLSAMPSAAQARGFLRLYAEFLELDVAALIPIQPVVAGPVSVTPSPAPAPETPQAKRSFLSGLRERLSRRPVKSVDIPAEPVALPASEPVAEEIPPASAADTTLVAPQSVAADIKTKPAPAAQVKKKAGS